MTLTPKSQEAADAIIEMIVALGRPPTIGELAKRLGLGNTATFARLGRLRAAGFLRDDDRIALGAAGMRLLALRLAPDVLGYEPGDPHGGRVPWPHPNA